jgi:hypothetical protein
MIRKAIVAIWILSAATAVAAEPFVLRVVDEDTGRGVPLVELKTTHNVRYYTDNAGLVAIDDAGLLGEEVFFFVESHGYQFPKDGFGYRGKRLRVESGKTAELKLTRINIAERLYRVTGTELYQHAIRAGERAPIEESRLNAQVVGCDSVQTTLFDGKLFWIWGDTSRLSYPLGNFHGSAAVSQLPEHGGLDPTVGINLDYFQSNNGFAQEIAPIPGDGPTWLTALVCVKDDDGRERLVATYDKIDPPLKVYERGLCEFDPDGRRFKKLFAFESTKTLAPRGHAFRHRDGDREWLYFGEAVPHLRVPERYESLIDPRQYEPVKADARFIDTNTGAPVKHHHGAVAWSPFRKKWTSIFTQEGGESSYLGEIYYAEADAPEGAWRKAVKILTHDRYSFYNPKQHPYFSEDGGRFLYFEGTYSAMFSRKSDLTPLYNYNQIMYRLDLSDRRLQGTRSQGTGSQ